MNTKTRIKKTLVSLYIPGKGRISYFVDAEVDDKGTARITTAQREDILRQAGITSNDCFAWCG